MSTAVAGKRRTLKVVCPHDCPDTCVMTVDVEDGRAVGIGGDPEHRFTAGFLCAKVNQLPRPRLQPGPHPAPAAARGAEGRGDVRADRLGRGARRRSPRASGDVDRAPRRRRRSCPTRTPATWACCPTAAWTGASSSALGASLLDRTICASAGAAGLQGDDRPAAWASTPRRSCTRASSWPGAPTSSAPTSTSGRSSRRRGGGARSSSRSTPTARARPRRRTSTSPCCPGTDAALALGMMHVIFRDGLEDRDYLERYTVGAADAARARAASGRRTRAAEVTGVAGRR